MKIDYNSPEMKLARVAGVIIVAVLVIGWAASQYTWVGDMMKSPGLNALKFLFVLMVFIAGAMLIRTAWQAIFGRGSVAGEEKIFSYKAMAAEAFVFVIGVALYWASQAGYFGSGWVMFPGP